MNHLDLNFGDVGPGSIDDKIWMAVVVTYMATLSVFSSLDTGTKYLSVVAFAAGSILLLVSFLFKNTRDQLNVFVQSVGHYLQYVFQIGFETAKNNEIDASKTNFLMLPPDLSSLLDRLRDEGINVADNSPTAIYEQSPTDFMDWRTVCYWGWWMSCAPFVGMLAAVISRDRTTHKVILGASIAPILYSGGELDSEKAKQLPDAGDYPLCCRVYFGHIYDVLDPYQGFEKFMYVLVLVRVCLYFVTPSDCGFYVGDLISANDHGYEIPPVPQRIYCCKTEGLTAIVLAKAESDEAIKFLRAVSIVKGLRYNMAVYFMCAAIHHPPWTVLIACAFALVNYLIACAFAKTDRNKKKKAVVRWGWGGRFIRIPKQTWCLLMVVLVLAVPAAAAPPRVPVKSRGPE